MNAYKGSDVVKLIVEESQDQKEIEVVIRCAQMNNQIQQLMNLIRSYSIMLCGKKQNCTYQIPIEQLQYIESVDDQTFLYCDDGVYECDQKLYELEEQLKYASCVRISKSCIVNINCLIHVKPLFDGKYIATTVADEKLVINRHYVKAFKEVFGL